MRPGKVIANVFKAGFHLVKAEQIHTLAGLIVDEQHGELPCSFDVMTSYPGIGPKCANLALGIACPFLEDESCSIYEERPITCREYLVTSPPEYCARVGSEGVRRVRLPLRVFNAVARWQVPPQEHFLERWVPLILAPEWADEHPETESARPGPELLTQLFGKLTGKEVEVPPLPFT